MASPGQFVPEYIVTANDMNDLPGGVLGYAERTSDLTGVTSETDVVTSSSVTVFSNRRIRVSASAEVTRAATSSLAISRLRIYQDTTQIQSRGVSPVGSSTGNAVSVAIWTVFTPSAGTYDFKLTLARELGDNTHGIAASATRPTNILVEDIGPA